MMSPAIVVANKSAYGTTRTTTYTIAELTRTAKADSLKPLIDRAMEVFDGEVIDRAPRGGERNS